MKKNRFVKALVSFVFFFALAIFIAPDTALAKPLDEILNYEITVDVKEDATLDIRYDISWKVLDSKSEGPLEWVKIGIPNSHYNSMEALTDNVDSMSYMSSGGSYARVDFDRKYYEGEVIDFSFVINQDYMYKVNPDEGYAEYTFTPGWFDDITVDNMTIRWNNDKADSWSDGCLVENGYNTWSKSLRPGEKQTVTVRYSVDAYSFDLEKYNNSKNDDDGYKYSEHNLIENILFTIVIIIFMVVIIVICALPFVGPALFVYIVYRAARGFGAGSGKRIRRTIIEYYPSCPNCGGAREHGKDECSYCGSSMVKKRQEIKEEDIKKDDKIRSFNKEGEFRYTDNPNTYVRVHVIPIVSPVRSTSSGRSSGGHHSSCAHSSCACACACACAGGGRAGCSTKDFYGTDLKLSHIRKSCMEKGSK